MRRVLLGLLPVVLLLAVLFGGGLAIAVLQSVGYFTPGGEQALTLAHYRNLFADAEFRDSVLVTLGWSTIASLASLVLGLAVALALRRIARGSHLLNAMLQVPIAVPHLAMAMIAVNLLGQSGLMARLAHAAGLIQAPGDFPEIFHDRYGAGILITYILKEAPFLALVALSMLRRTGLEYEAVAATLGASAWQQFRYVTLPLVAPPLISATLIVFAYIFGSFEIPFLLGRPYPAMLGVLLQRRFLSGELNDRPDAIAVGVLMSCVSALVVLAYLRLSSRLVGERPTLF